MGETPIGHLLGAVTRDRTATPGRRERQDTQPGLTCFQRTKSFQTRLHNYVCFAHSR